MEKKYGRFVAEKNNFFHFAIIIFLFTYKQWLSFWLQRDFNILPHIVVSRHGVCYILQQLPMVVYNNHIIKVVVQLRNRPCTMTMAKRKKNYITEINITNKRTGSELI